MKSRARLARLHFINTVFNALTGHDLYLASQMLEALEQAQRDTGTHDQDLASFPDLVARLTRLLPDDDSSDASFSLCAGDWSGPLFLRAELIAALRRNALRRQSTVMITDLPASGAVPLRSKKRAGTRAREHAETVAQLRDIAARAANPRSAVTLLFV